MRRTTATVFNEFGNEDNLASIFGKEILNHWYLLLLLIVLMFAMFKLYRKPKSERKNLVWWKYDLLYLVFLGLAVYISIVGMRGGFTRATRPITISNANQYVDRPIEAALVLNTPFSIIRTIGVQTFQNVDYYATEEELENVFTPVHNPLTNNGFRQKNVVVLIVESFGREYIGAFNRDLENGEYKGFTPFVDSLIEHSATFRYSYSNGRKSIDGMPSVLSSIPMFVEPFVLTPASMNRLSGLACELGKKGYSTGFFHGAQNGSMGFQAFARSTGFGGYYGRDEYNADSRFGGDADFDGTWAIWDEPFLQFYCTTMSEMQQPFMTAVFTASSHHPYNVPDEYKSVFPEGDLSIHKCIGYTDNALRKFFDSARKQPWYNNTIFVITADHTNETNHAEYQTDLGSFSVPIIIYEPGNDSIANCYDKVAQHIDIMPTILGMLGYDNSYLAFGCDLFATSAEQCYAVNYLNGIYQYVKYGYVLQFDGTNTKAIYALDDKLMKNNLVGQVECQQRMEDELKAIIQQYMSRMNGDRLVVE
jgi:phosphoglycerol transferase MdoB-like AlkP superfamily enzyme